MEANRVSILCYWNRCVFKCMLSSFGRLNLPFQVDFRVDRPKTGSKEAE